MRLDKCIQINLRYHANLMLVIDLQETSCQK